MAILLDNALATHAGGGTNTISTSYTVTSGDFLLVFIAHFNSAISVTSMTFNSVGLTYFGNIGYIDQSSTYIWEVWSLVAPSTGAHTLTINLSGNLSVGNDAGVLVSSYTGVHQTTPFDVTSTYLLSSFTAITPGTALTSYSGATNTNNAWLTTGYVAFGGTTFTYSQNTGILQAQTAQGGGLPQSWAFVTLATTTAGSYTDSVTVNASASIRSVQTVLKPAAVVPSTTNGAFLLNFV